MLSATVLAAMESSETVAELATEQNPASLLLVMMVVVFLILMLLWFLVAAVGKLFVAHEKSKQAPPKDKGPTPPAPSGTGAPMNKAALDSSTVSSTVKAASAAPAVEPGISDETVAAIVGAVTAFESAQGTRGVIRSIRRSDGSAPARVRTRSAWSQAGVAGNTTPFGV